MQIVRYRTLPPGPQRQQIRWVLFGFAAAALMLAASTLTGMIGQEAVDPASWAWALMAADAGAFLVVLSAGGGLVISVVRYRLFDADAVISRSAGYAILTLALAGLWAGAEKALEVLFAGQFGHGGRGGVGGRRGGAGGAAGDAGPPPGDALDRAGVPETPDKAAPRIAGICRRSAGDRLGRAPARRGAGADRRRAKGPSGGDGIGTGERPRLAASYGIDRAAAAIWLKSADLTGDGLVREPADAMFPLRLPLAVTGDGREVIGWLALGPRPDGSFYGRDELDALKAVAGPVARAVRIAQLREAREGGLTRELKAIRAELAALRPAIVS